MSSRLAVYSSRTSVDVRAMLMQIRLFQLTAIDDAALCNADCLIQQKCTLRSASATALIDIFAAGESMTIDIKKNNATVLTAILTLNAANVTARGVEVDFTTLDATKTTFNAGDTVTAALDYTAGGGPTPLKGTHILLVFDPVMS